MPGGSSSNASIEGWLSKRSRSGFGITWTRRHFTLTSLRGAASTRAVLSWRTSVVSEESRTRLLLLDRQSTVRPRGAQRIRQ